MTAITCRRCATATTVPRTRKRMKIRLRKEPTAAHRQKAEQRIAHRTLRGRMTPTAAGPPRTLRKPPVSTQRIPNRRRTASLRLLKNLFQQHRKAAPDNVPLRLLRMRSAYRGSRFCNFSCRRKGKCPQKHEKRLKLAQKPVKLITRPYKSIRSCAGLSARLV